jgi:EamA domain-containing membrane protein RarD
MYRSAVEKPRNLVVVLGVWLLGLSAVAFGCSVLREALDSSGIAAWTALLVGLGAITWASLLIVRTTQNYRAIRRTRGVCSSC